MLSPDEELEERANMHKDFGDYKGWMPSSAKNTGKYPSSIKTGSTRKPCKSTTTDWPTAPTISEMSRKREENEEKNYRQTRAVTDAHKASSVPR
jgi:hypothetical protein